MLRGKQDEKPYCLTGECFPDFERCLTTRVPVASLISARATAPLAYRSATAATSSSRATILIRLIISPADEHRSGANQMRQHLSFREHFRRGNAASYPDCRATSGSLPGGPAAAGSAPAAVDLRS